MRRSTAAAIGTLTGAALIVGVRLSVTPVNPQVSAPVVNLAGSSATPKPTKSGSSKNGAAKNGASKNGSSGSGSAKNGASDGGAGADATKPAAPKGEFKDGTYQGKGANNPYGTVQVSIKVSGGAVTAADATYPVAGNSATINPSAIATLKQETLGVKSAKDVAAVSGATVTTGSYRESLQAALDSAKA